MKGFCSTVELSSPTRQPSNVNSISEKPVTLENFTFKTQNDCVSDSDCGREGFICRDGKCVYWTTIGEFFIAWAAMIGIGFFCCGVCHLLVYAYDLSKKALETRRRRLAELDEVENNSPFDQGALPPDNWWDNLPAAVETRYESTNPTGMRIPETNDLELPTAVLEIENASSILLDVPPPYNTLDSERQKSVTEDLPEEPPPSYDEAVKTFET